MIDSRHSSVAALDRAEADRRLIAATELLYASHGQQIDGHQLDNILNGRWFAVRAEFGGENHG